MLLSHLENALINVLGRTLWITCCGPVGLFVGDERSYERFCAEAERLYRVQRAWEPVRGEASIRAGDVELREDRLYYAENAVLGVLSVPLVAGDPARSLRCE